MAKDIQTIVDDVVGALTLEELIDQTPGPVQVPEKDPTDEVVRSIVTKLQHPEVYNGYLGIARSEGVSTGTVKMIEKAVRDRIADLSPHVDPEPMPK